MGKDSVSSDNAGASSARVAFMDGRGELPLIEVNTPWSSAEIYLAGANVTHFQKKNEAPLLFLSQCSRFLEGQPIRGGIPIIFPWFGSREGMSQHGFARTKTWNLKEVHSDPDGSVRLLLRLPQVPESATFPPFSAEYSVTVSERLHLGLVVRNESEDEPFAFENCLHTYFEVSDLAAVSITGLKGREYLDKTSNFARKRDSADAIRIQGETDRIYLDTPDTIEIVDARHGRKIRVEKQGSVTTVVWNPWEDRARQIPDFANEEFSRMVCVESGNVSPNEITLQPGESSLLSVSITSEPLR